MNHVDNLKRIGNEDVIISRTLTSLFVVLMLEFFILSCFSLFDTRYENIIQISSKIIVGLLFFYSFGIICKRSLRSFFLIYLLASITILLTLLIHPENFQQVKSVLFKFIFISLPCFLYTYSIRDIKIFKRTIEGISKIIFIIGLLLTALAAFGKIDLGVYNLSISYHLLLPALVFIYRFFEDQSIKNLLYAILSLLIILSIGARSPLLSVIVYVVLYKVIELRHITRTKAFLNLIFFSIGIFFMIFYREILLFINNVLLKFNIYSRSITLFLQDKVHLSGREVIYNEILLRIYQNPFIGLGIAGDRVYTNSHSHNVFLELLSNYGIIIGSALIIGLCILTFKAVLIRDKEIAHFIVLWFSLGFIPLLINDTILIYFQFWIFLGLVLNVLSRKTNLKFEKAVNLLNRG